MLSDPGRDVVASRPSTGASTRLGHLLPHLAMVVAMACSPRSHWPAGRASLTVLGVLLCVTLAAAHRWGTARDEQRLGAQLRRNEAYFRSLVQSSSDAVVLLDDDLRVTWSSPALAHVLGAAAGDLLGRSLLAVVHPEDAAELSAALPSCPVPVRRRRRTTPTARGLFLLRLRDADGVWHVLEAVVSDQRADPFVEAVVLHCRDMTVRHEREQVLQSVAYSDPATGLPNRAGLLVALGRALRSRPAGLPAAGRARRTPAAREHIGREEVRHVVAEIGRRLRAAVRADDVVARMGGGAFAVMAVRGDCPARMRTSSPPAVSPSSSGR